MRTNCVETKALVFSTLRKTTTLSYVYISSLWDLKCAQYLNRDKKIFW